AAPPRSAAGWWMPPWRRAAPTTSPWSSPASGPATSWPPRATRRRPGRDPRATGRPARALWLLDPLLLVAPFQHEEVLLVARPEPRGRLLPRQRVADAQGVAGQLDDPDRHLLLLRGEALHEDPAGRLARVQRVAGGEELLAFLVGPVDP